MFCVDLRLARPPALEVDEGVLAWCVGAARDVPRSLSPSLLSLPIAVRGCAPGMNGSGSRYGEVWGRYGEIWGDMRARHERVRLGVLGRHLLRGVREADALLIVAAEGVRSHDGHLGAVEVAAR